METLERVLESINSVVWGPLMLALLFGTHVYLTFRLRFIQRYLGRAIRLSFQRTPEGHGDVSPFGAVTTETREYLWNEQLDKEAAAPADRAASA